MITTTCKPLTARRWFSLRTPVNLVIVLAGFIVVVFLLQNIIHPLLADLIALAFAYATFFHVLGKRGIVIDCPDCDGYIETNTPWKCGNPNCQKDNERVNDFPVVYHCEHCGVEPKAFECPKCGKPIYLGKDKLKTIYAKFITLPEKIRSKPARRDPAIFKIEKEKEDIRQTERKLEKAKLELELKGVRDQLEPIKLKTVGERLRKGVFSRTELDDEVRRMKAEADKEFAKDEPARLKRHGEIDAEARELL